MPEDRDADVVHDVEHSRYELCLHGQLAGVADYVVDARRGGVVVFTHTEIDAPRRGQGLGERLVRGALDDVRASGRRAHATCWFVCRFEREHPEYADLFG